MIHGLHTTLISLHELKFIPYGRRDPDDLCFTCDVYTIAWIEIEVDQARISCDLPFTYDGYTIAWIEIGPDQAHISDNLPFT